MRILVYPHELSIGGSQINAIDLAAEVAALGHEALVYAQPGPLAEYVTSRGLRYVPAHDLRYRPAPTRIVQLARLARRERIDVMHAYEWPPALDAYYGAHAVFGVPVVATVLSMGFTPLIPSSVPLLIGTRKQADELRQDWPGRVEVMEPPIDTAADNPSNDGTGFRRAHGISDDEFLVTSVSRLSVELKLDALVDAVDGVAQIAGRYPIRLLLVGDGPAEPELRLRAAAVNQQAGRVVVELPGAVLDPRPAYAAADVVLGMGSSALRAMAHGKPVIVQGERGFARLLDEASIDTFGWTGFFGTGDGRAGGSKVARALESLVDDPARRTELGALGRRLVIDRYSLRAAALSLVDFYTAAIAERPRARVVAREVARTAWLAGSLEVSNHRPSRKRLRRAEEAARLAEARGRAGA